MQAIIFSGIQASGKSLFYMRNFFNSHIRISMDLFNTRNKENSFLQTCFAMQARFVVDNTNPTKEERGKYISKAQQSKYEVIGYFFQTALEEALERNKQRKGKEQIPEKGIRGCYSKLKVPQIEEGFDKLFLVTIENEEFVVSECNEGNVS